MDVRPGAMVTICGHKGSVAAFEDVRGGLCLLSDITEFIGRTICLWISSY